MRTPENPPRVPLSDFDDAKEAFKRLASYDDPDFTVRVPYGRDRLEKSTDVDGIEYEYEYPEFWMEGLASGYFATLSVGHIQALLDVDGGKAIIADTFPYRHNGTNQFSPPLSLTVQDVWIPEKHRQRVVASQSREPYAESAKVYELVKAMNQMFSEAKAAGAVWNPRNISDAKISADDYYDFIRARCAVARKNGTQRKEASIKARVIQALNNSEVAPAMTVLFDQLRKDLRGTK